MKTVWKFVVPVVDEFELTLPEGAALLCVEPQAATGEVCLWALVDPDRERVERRFRIFGTGHPITSEGLEYVGTFQLQAGRFVGHLFEAT